MLYAGLPQLPCYGSSNWKHMALSALSIGLFSWSHGTSTIRELTVTPLEEGQRGEEERGWGHIRQLLRLCVTRLNNITRDKHRQQLTFWTTCGRCVSLSSCRHGMLLLIGSTILSELTCLRYRRKQNLWSISWYRQVSIRSLVYTEYSYHTRLWTQPAALCQLHTSTCHVCISISHNTVVLAGFCWLGRTNRHTKTCQNTCDNWRWSTLYDATATSYWLVDTPTQTDTLKTIPAFATSAPPSE